MTDLQLPPRTPARELPAWRKVHALPPEAKAVIATLMEEIQADAVARATRCWRLGKAPQAAYWSSVGHYVRYIQRALKRR